ncbi:MAG: glycoside hydrolase family 2 protein [Candidatus Helarchaeota archaeon]
MNRIQLLNGNWKIRADDNGVGDDEEWWWTRHKDSDWDEAPVPGHWQESVLPNYEGTVWYRLLFDLDPTLRQEFGPRIILRFYGIFYYSQVWLNNEYLGEHEGYFDPFEFDITNLVDDNNNLLCVKVVCNKINDLNEKVQLTGVFSHWDASDPNFNPGGIWNNVELIKKSQLYLKDLSIITDISNSSPYEGRIKIKFNIDSLITSDIKIQFNVKPKNFQGTAQEESISFNVEPGDNWVNKEIIIEDARFWWTHDHGFPNLYDLTISVFKDNQEIDKLNTFFGLKKIELKKNKGWEFYLNNKRIFIKGSNYAPQNQRLVRPTKDDYKKDIEMMINANFNMIRVHAHIDRKELHEVASELGILIWQDFPLQWYYNRSILNTALTQTKSIIHQLSNYPAQAVWCCHNEPFKVPTKKELLKLLFTFIICGVFSSTFLLLFNNSYLPIMLLYLYSSLIFIISFFLISIPLELFPTAILIYNWNKNVLDKRLAKLVSELCPQYPVIKSSGIPFKTDFHWYDGWYFNPGKYWKANKFSKGIFRKYIPFVSEYGAQSFPNIETIKKFGLNIEWPISKEMWKTLKKDFRCQINIFKKIFKMELYPDYNEFITATQIYQANLLKFHNELWRKLRFNNVGGTLCFQFNDCSPLITWSIIDFYNELKIAYNKVSLSFEPLYAFLNKWPRKFKKNSLFKNNILLVNDYLNDFNDINIKIIVKSPTKTILETNYKCNIKADSLIEVDKIEFRIPDEIGEYTLNIHLSTESISILNPYKFKVI